MKRKILGLVIAFIAVISALSCVFWIWSNEETKKDSRAQQIVAANEIEQLIRLGEYDKAGEKTAALREDITKTQDLADGSTVIVIMWGISTAFIIVLFLYVYFSILRPFDKLKIFAEKISLGDFDVPLDYERSNYFGSFTWAFDSMRCEITRARACEKEAIHNNKTVIATLAHDIKTPIASIRAYSEGLEANLDVSPEKRQRFVSVIMRKCDEVARLTNDLFLHSMSDLEKLKIVPKRLELCSYMEEISKELQFEHNDVKLLKPEFEAEIMADANRLMQIAENIINNARKYAKTNIDISMVKAEDTVEINFRDYGSGIPDEDMPFIMDKFYRGKNAGSEQGSGLGLYIVKYLTEQMDGKLKLRNLQDGLMVTVSFPVI